MMTFATVRYLGTTGATFTNDKTYDFVDWLTVIGDDGSIQPMSIGTDWEFVSVFVLSPKQVYP